MENNSHAIRSVLIDFSQNEQHPARVVVYLDGPDARVFKRLVSKLGSEESAQNAIILLGFLTKLRETGAESQALQIENHWRSLVGVTKGVFDSVMEDI